MTRFPLATASAIAATTLFLAGCGGKGKNNEMTTPPVNGTTTQEHSHSSTGPHGGSIVELGGAYHAEVAHADDGGVIVYILDGNAAANLAIEADEVKINVTHDGQPAQFVLTASPEAGEADGMSSRFVTSDSALGELLDEEEATAKLVVTIDGTPYSGTIEHAHDHAHGDGHDHAAHGHSHSGDDALVWEQQDIEHEGYSIMLGHHGEHLHADEGVEPAVSITKDGEAVADAQVFNALVSADAATVVAEEVATVYEPETDEEPAHYAQGELMIPAGVDKIVIRFRIVLPGDAGEVSYDVPVDVE